MDIITDIEKLSIRANEVGVCKGNKQVRETTLALKDTIREKKLFGLSANQIGSDLRMFVINFNGDLRTFINPIITQVKGFELSKETCSSLPDKTYLIPRHNDIQVMYTTPLGAIETKRFMGASARLIQHHIQHLDGMLLSDIGLEVDDLFFNATEEERQQVISMYLDSLDIKEKAINKEIQSDEELKKIADGIEFMTKVQRGEVKLEAVQKEEVSN